MVDAFRSKIRREDGEFLSDPEQWPQQDFVCVKEHSCAPRVEQRFGLYMRDRPNTVVVRDVATDEPLDVICYDSLDRLLDVWTVD